MERVDDQKFEIGTVGILHAGIQKFCYDMIWMKVDGTRQATLLQRCCCILHDEEATHRGRTAAGRQEIVTRIISISLLIIII